jgi:glycosyltransferase involved in cell wall biosynthesis
MHEVGTLVDLLGSALPNGVVMSFYASGSGYMELRRRTLQMHADYYGPLLEADWVRCLHDSHVGLITLEPGAEKVAMPSKTYSALVAGQAIIAVCPETSDLAALVQTHDCGWVVPPGDAKKLREVLVAIEADRELLYNKRRRAFAVAHAYYDMTPICSRWTALLQELIDQNVGASVASGKARPLI